jgi:adenylate cyclase
MQVGDGFFEAMSLAVVRVYLGNAPIKVETTIVDAGGRKLGWMRFVHVGDAVRIPLDERMAVLVPYRSEGSFRYVSATDVIRGTLGADELKDRIVIVGTSARDSSTSAPRLRGKTSRVRRSMRASFPARWTTP